MSALQIRKMTYAALYLAIAMVLPFITGQIPEIGAMLCPMHIPVLLCGFMCGWPWGLAVGLIAPPLRFALFAMPVDFGAMAFELAAYGGMAGLLYSLLPKKNVYIYMALILSMIAGRIAWGTVHWVTAGLSGSSFTWEMYVGSVVLGSIPGIILQIVLIPLVVIAMERAGLTLNRKRTDSKEK